MICSKVDIWKVNIAEYPDLGTKEKKILWYIAKAKNDVTTKELLENLPEYKRDSMHKGLAIFQEKGMIQKKGASVSSRYAFCPSALERSGFSKEAQVFMDIANRGQKE